MIQSVEVLPSELEGLALGYGECLRQRQVQHSFPRPAQRIAMHVTVTIKPLWRRESRRIEPQIGAWAGNVRVPNLIGTNIVEVRVDVTCIGNVDRKWHPSIERRDSVQHPTANPNAHRPADLAAPAAA